jgi:sugar phosphate isomerase/epimerase
MTLLLTLSASSMTDLIQDPKHGPSSLLEVPRFAIDHLGLRGLYLDATLLSGWSLKEMDRLRDQADKAGCPCLVLYDETLLGLGEADESIRTEAVSRIERLASAANRLGCNSVAIRCAHTSAENGMEVAMETLRGVMAGVERQELNLLLRPTQGMTETPDGITDLVKKVGGFRIGVLPRFGTAFKADEEVERLRRLAPYAGAMLFEVKAFKGKSGHAGSDLTAGVETLRKVGYASTVCIDYVGPSPLRDLDKAREEMQAAIEAV